MVYSIYLEPGEISRFMDAIRTHPTLTGMYSEELQLREKYSHLQRPVFQRVQERLDLDFLQTISDPIYSFLTERLVHVFLSPNGNVVDPEEIDYVAQRSIDMTRKYLDASDLAYRNIRNKKKLPKKLLREIVAWSDFPNYHTPSEKPKMAIATDPTQRGRRATSILRNLAECVDHNGKAFLIGGREAIGSLILDTTSEMRHKGYPYDIVYERGGWSLDYFTGEYVRRHGFSPHLNVVMTFLSEGREFRPFCRISRDGNAWLLKLDLGMKGYNPED